MFNILKYSEDFISGSVEIKVIYQSNLKSQDIIDGGTFTNRATADNWLENLQRTWFGMRVDNYIIHKRHILENAPGHKSVTNKINTLQELTRYSEWLAEKATLKEACTWFIKLQDKFTFILPGQNNPSRPGAEQELNNLLSFAKKIVNNTLLKKAS